MNRLIRDWGAALLVGIVVFFVADVVAKRDKPDNGMPAPAFTLPAVGGEPVALESLRGRTVVLNFWATWCGPCKQEIPDFSAYAKEHPEVSVLGVLIPSNEGPRLASIVEGLKIGYPVVVADSQTEHGYGISVFPTTVVVRADGTIASAHEGRLTRGQLAQLVSAAGS